MINQISINKKDFSEEAVTQINKTILSFKQKQAEVRDTFVDPHLLTKLRSYKIYKEKDFWDGKASDIENISVMGMMRQIALIILYEFLALQFQLQPFEESFLMLPNGNKIYEVMNTVISTEYTDIFSLFDFLLQKRTSKSLFQEQQKKRFFFDILTRVHVNLEEKFKYFIDKATFESATFSIAIKKMISEESEITSLQTEKLKAAIAQQQKQLLHGIGGEKSFVKDVLLKVKKIAIEQKILAKEKSIFTELDKAPEDWNKGILEKFKEQHRLLEQKIN